MTPTRLIESLRGRWTPAQIVEVNRALLSNGSPPAVFGEYNGCLDYRGLLLTGTIERSRLVRIDLSFARTGTSSGIRDCSVESCRFVGLVGIPQYSFTFASVDFSRSEIYRLRGWFTDCVFDGAKLFGLSGDQVRFVTCSFRKANLRNAMLTHCLFENCDFTGARLRGASFGMSRFIGDSIFKQDLSKTYLEKIRIVEGKSERIVTMMPDLKTSTRMAEAELREERPHKP